MKKIFLFWVLLVSISCRDDITDKKFRNAKYAFYQEEGKSGKWIRVVANSELDLPKSKSTYFFNNGTLYAELIVLDSFPNRINRFYDTDGNQTVTEQFSNDSLISKNYENGHCKGYYSNNGNLKSEGEVIDNNFEGTWIFYREDGNTIKQTLDYVNGIFNGLRKDYYETGELKAIISQKNGEKNGKSIYYFKNGEIKESKTYKNSKEYGKLFRYFEDGSIEYSGNFWNGKEIDTCRKYYPNGKLKQIFICVADTVNKHFEGKLYSYYESGISKAYFELVNYELNGTSKFYNKKGKLIEHKTTKNNEVTGGFIEYYDSGKTKIIGNYNLGYYDKEIKYYSEKGILVKTVNYQEGIALDSITH